MVNWQNSLLVPFTQVVFQNNNICKTESCQLHYKKFKKIENCAAWKRVVKAENFEEKYIK